MGRLSVAGVAEGQLLTVFPAAGTASQLFLEKKGAAGGRSQFSLQLSCTFLSFFFFKLYFASQQLSTLHKLAHFSHLLAEGS